jgi:hypothetical protein
LICSNGGIGNYRYDLLFVFNSEYNNRGIQHESVLATCDELFDWFDLTIVCDLSIVVMNKWGKNYYYSYFELMDEICRTNSYYHMHESRRHPKFQQYKEWKNEKYRRRLVREHYEHWEPLIQSVPTKKKSLFW